MTSPSIPEGRAPQDSVALTLRPYQVLCAVCGLGRDADTASSRGIRDAIAAFPDLPNAALVERATNWAADAGRPIASADNVRERFREHP